MAGIYTLVIFPRQTILVKGESPDCTVQFRPAMSPYIDFEPIYVSVIYCLEGFSAESNAYFVVSDKACVIDPGIDPVRVLNHSRDYNIRIDVLINTHCHFDHVGANLGVLSSGKVDAFCHPVEAPALEKGDGSLQLSGLFGMEPVCHRVDRVLSDGDIVDLGGVTLEVIHTPGHTAGSICLFEPESKSLFSGDTVFADSVGRTDFKGGSSYELERSVRRLAGFAAERDVANVYPGHGQAFDAGNIGQILEVYF
jgi:hydroxyacylglutathione hydrolase